MTSPQRFAIPSHVMSRELGDDCVMLDLASGTYFGLDPVGARLWQLLGEGRTVAEACDVLAAEYEAGRDEIEADVGELLESLAAQGLVVPA